MQVEVLRSNKTQGRGATGVDGRYQLLGLRAGVIYTVRTDAVARVTPSSKKATLGSQDLLTVDFVQSTK